MAEFFRRYVLRNLLLKLVSFGMAIALWWAVRREPMAEVAFTVPIEFHNIADNLEISSENLPQAQIRVRGTVRLVRNLKPSDLHAEIDLAGAKMGDRTFDLTSQQMRAPQDLEVVQVVPSQVRVTIDTRQTRRVEVRPRVIGTFAAGYRIAQILAQPAEITIAGPRKRVEAIEAALTDPVDASGTIARGSFITHAYLSDPLVQVVHPEPIRVTVIMEKAPIGSGAN